MSDQDGILSHNQVLQRGTNFDLLSYNADQSLVLDDFEVCGGKPFTGLAYELQRSKKLAWYAYFNAGKRLNPVIRFDADEKPTHG